MKFGHLTVSLSKSGSVQMWSFSILFIWALLLFKNVYCEIICLGFYIIIIILCITLIFSYCISIFDVFLLYGLIFLL